MYLLYAQKLSYLLTPHVKNNTCRSHTFFMVRHCAMCAWFAGETTLNIAHLGRLDAQCREQCVCLLW